MDDTLEAFLAAPTLHVDVAGTPMSYRRIGRGPAIVLVHGWPLSGSTYHGLVAALQHEFTCWVPDLPGAGGSPWRADIRESFTGLARALVGFVDAVGLQRFALVGHDSGGGVARIAAAELGDRVSAMLLSNTEVPGQVATLVAWLQRLTRMPGAAWIVSWLLRSRAYLRSRLGFGGAFADVDAALAGPFARSCIEPLRRDPGGAFAMLRRADLGVVHELPQIHQRIVAPLLCVWGDRDPFFPLAGAHAMVAAWPVAARLEVLPGLKLFLHEEAPQRLAALALPFLREHCGARTALAMPA
jgi:pimeloyl-ACP methyl ester carboxylesterase